jgi:two-component system cell cycle sensor histidine kinase/response regulator CckA
VSEGVRASVSQLDVRGPLKDAPEGPLPLRRTLHGARANGDPLTTPPEPLIAIRALEARIGELEAEIARLRTRTLSNEAGEVAPGSALPEREAVFEEVERLAKVGSWVWDVRTNRVAWSSELYRILGYELDLAPSVELFFEALHEDDREWVRARSEKSASTGHTEPSARCRVVHKDGSIRHVVIVGSPLRDEQGNLVRLVGALRDITEFVESEAKLRETADLLSEAQTIAGIGSFTWRLDSGKVEWSATMAAIAGVDVKARGVTSRLLDRIHPEDRPRVDEFRRELAGGVAPAPFELRVLLLDGSLRYMTLNARIQSGSGAGLVVGTVQDVTAQRTLEQQLRHAQKMEAVGRLAGGVAHDFNNYLVVIRGNLDLLRDAVTETTREALDEIAHASDRCATLTRQLLAFARKHPVEPRLIDAAQIVVESANMIKRIMGEAVELSVHASTGTALILADPSQLELVLLNLAINARDAMPEGGRLDIAVSTHAAELELSKLEPTLDAGFVKIEVRDTGSGIADELKPRVFEPFFTTKRQGHGTGLGLATAYGIVRQAGGHIELSSELGKGTSFRLYLPLRKGKGARSGRSPGSPPSARGELVLLAEDEPGVRRLTRRLLERGGYKVVDAENGAKALEVAGQLDEIHLLLSDITMPKMDGIALARNLRAQRPEVRVLLMSGYPDPDAQGLAEKEFRNPILNKPFTLEQLLAAVRKAITDA